MKNPRLFVPNDYPFTMCLVQLARLNGDSKAFPDSVIKSDRESLAALEQKMRALFPSASSVEDVWEELEPAVVLAKRVLELVTPHLGPSIHVEPNAAPIEEHIARMWDVLRRRSSEFPDSSVLDLENPYIVPGGRYSEMYYWDSYFTCEGLAAAGKFALMRGIIENCAQQIRDYGYAPNGNRTYYIGRSQAPFFSAMCDLDTDPCRHYDVLRTEYRFWMEGEGEHKGLRFDPHTGLNHYSDSNDTPRPEGYWEDVATALAARRAGRTDIKTLFRDLRAAAESGWDFSSRWLEPGSCDLHTIRTTRILPVDLNSLLYRLETTIARMALLRGDHEECGLFVQKAAVRREAMLRLMWDPAAGWFQDCDVDEQKTGVLSLAGLYPLFAGVLDPKLHQDIAKLIEATVCEKFLKLGGVVTTLTHSGQQWDAPAGWAPLHWIAVAGLAKYGFEPLAAEIANRFRTQIERVYKKTGRIMEKYDVEDLGKDAGGGEYPLQEGFGWSNAVYLALARYATPKPVH